MLPGTSPAFLKTGRSPAEAPIINGEVAPDPSKALEAATKAFDSAGDTLKSINQAAAGIAKISESAGEARRVPHFGRRRRQERFQGRRRDQRRW